MCWGLWEAEGEDGHVVHELGEGLVGEGRAGADAAEGGGGGGIEKGGEGGEEDVGVLAWGEGRDGGAAAQGGVEVGEVGAEEAAHAWGVVGRGVVGEAQLCAWEEPPRRGGRAVS